MNKSPLPRRRRAGLQAFSLIEIVLAIGVMAIAVIPLVALLPSGYLSYRAAGDSMTQTAIARYVSSMMASKTPSTWVMNDIYFTDEMATNSSSVGAAYRVTFISTNNPSFSREGLPSDAGTVNLNRLWRVSYEIWDARVNRKLGTGGFDIVDREANTN